MICPSVESCLLASLVDNKKVRNSRKFVHILKPKKYRSPSFKTSSNLFHYLHKLQLVSGTDQHHVTKSIRRRKSDRNPFNMDSQQTTKILYVGCAWNFQTTRIISRIRRSYVWQQRNFFPPSILSVVQRVSHLPVKHDSLFPFDGKYCCLEFLFCYGESSK